MAEKEYQRLTRARLRRKGLFVAATTRSSLWLGKDHLLSIDSTYFTEEYKRFYFRDIQAIIIRRTNRRATWNIVLISLLVVWLVSLGLIGLSSGLDTATVGLMGIPFLILAVPLLVNNVLGPACAFYLRTAVQIEELPSLNRVRRAQRKLERLRPLIAAAQGQLTPEEISMRLREINQPVNYA